MTKRLSCRAIPCVVGVSQNTSSSLVIRGPIEVQTREDYSLDSIHTGSWAWNVSSGELFWSEEHFHICGLDPEKVKLSYPTSLQSIHPEDRELAQQAFDRAIRERSDFEQECRIVRPDGATRHIRSFAHPVFDESGELIEYVGTIIDITEQHQARAALEKAFEEIKILRDRLYHLRQACSDETFFID